VIEITPKIDWSEMVTFTSPAETLMAEKDLEALVLIIKYCEEEAIRLGLPAVGIHCLQIARGELTKSVAAPAPTVTTNYVSTKH
jgi:hypothetical protein